MKRQLPNRITAETAVKNYIKAVNKGLLKVFSKMGISTLQSYRGAQVFEAIGLNRELVDKYFTGTPSRIEGIGLDVLPRRPLRNTVRLPPGFRIETELSVGGNYQYRVQWRTPFAESADGQQTAARCTAAKLRNFPGIFTTWSMSRARSSARCAA